MRINRMQRITAAASAVLTAGLLAACGPDDENSSPEQSSQPTASATKPSDDASTASPKASASKSGQVTTSPSVSASKSKPSLDEIVFAAIKKAEKDGTLIDIGLTNNAACSKSKGETLELSKITGGWDDSPYALVSGYADAPINLTPDSYKVVPHKGIGNPRSDWSFSCNGSALGYYTIRFVEIGVEGEDPQVTEEVAITVSE